MGKDQVSSIEDLRYKVNQILGEYYYPDRSTLDPNAYVHADAMAELEDKKADFDKSLAKLELTIHNRK
jgi:hypothetical protein